MSLNVHLARLRERSWSEATRVRVFGSSPPSPGFASLADLSRDAGEVNG
jgi:hypothetical protein